MKWVFALFVKFEELCVKYFLEALLPEILLTSLHFCHVVGGPRILGGGGGQHMILPKFPKILRLGRYPRCSFIHHCESHSVHQDWGFQQNRRNIRQNSKLYAETYLDTFQGKWHTISFLIDEVWEVTHHWVSALVEVICSVWIPGQQSHRPAQQLGLVLLIMVDPLSKMTVSLWASLSKSAFQ